MVGELSVRLLYLCPKSLFFVPFKMGELRAFESFRLIFPRLNLGLHQVSMVARCCSVYRTVYGRVRGDLAKLPGTDWLWPPLPGPQKPLVG